MNVIKIVLTGGPCAGKTKTLDALIKHLKETQDGKYKVLVSTESATELIQNGIHPNEANTMYNFQDLIFQYQTSKEKVTEQAVTINKNFENYILLYDRGIIDNKAYLNNQKEFDTFLDKYNYDEISILDNYNLVIDLLSLATCDDKLYEGESNPARYEDVKTAKEIDKKTTEAWLGHRNIKLFNSNRPLDDKINDIINLVDDVINSNQRNYLTEYYIEETMKSFTEYNDNNSKLIYVNDNYLDIPNDMNYEYIVKRRIYKDNSSYIFEIKKNIDDIEKIIKSEVISESDAINLITTNNITKSISKYELTFLENNQIYKVNFYDNYTTLEFEENKFNEKLVLPNNINIIGKVKDIEKPIVKTKKIC